MSRELPPLVMLHGFRMNGNMMRHMMAAICDGLTPERPLLFPDAPNAASGPAFPFITKNYPGQAVFEWWNAQDAPGQGVRYLGAARSIEQLAADVPEGSVLMGYSQGAAMAALLSAMMDGGEVRNKRLTGLVLFNSGPPPRDPELRGWFDQPLRTRSLHVLGGPTDMTHSMQLSMLDCFAEEARSTAAHDEGHRPPSVQQSPSAVEAVVGWLTQLG